MRRHQDMSTLQHQIRLEERYRREQLQNAFEENLRSGYEKSTDADWDRIRYQMKEDQLREQKVVLDKFKNQADKPVYLFVRFAEDKAEYVAQTVVLATKTVRCSKGIFRGIARKVQHLSTQHANYKPEALVMYLFESTKRAEEFFFTNDRMKQFDFPSADSHAEAWAISQYLHPRDDWECNSYMYCETHLNHTSDEALSWYKKSFVKPFADLIMQYGGQPFIVQSVGVHQIRNHYVGDNTLVTLHLFREENDIKHMMQDERYHDLRSLQMSIGYDITSVFTIDREACP